MCVSRAQAITAVFDASVRDLDFANLGDRGVEMMTMDTSPGSNAIELLTVNLALLQVAIEAWRRFKFEDAEIDRLLSIESHTEWLKNVRHRVFHPAIEDEWRPYYRVPSERFMAWSTYLLDAMIDYCRREFAKPEWRLSP